LSAVRSLRSSSALPPIASPGFVGYAIDGAGDVAWIESDDATDFLVAITATR
jgi:hypothetical protein